MALPKIALVDSHSLIHRAYHALPPMSTKDGVPTNAVYGFTTMLLKMFSTIKPTHVVAAFDVKGPTFRSEKFADYKAHRKAAAEDLVVQFDLVRQVVEAFGIPVVEKKGFEADDVIGTLVDKIGDTAKKIVVTGDQDLLQLVDDSTSVFSLKRGMTDTLTYTPVIVKEKLGFEPKYVPDFKALAGDPSDNIKGVAGIGAKTAKDLVSRFGSLENIFTHLEELPTRVQRRLAGQEKTAYLSRELATIRRDVPLMFSLEAGRMQNYDVEKVRQIFSELEFRSLWQRLPAGRSGDQPTLLKNTAGDKLPTHYHLIESVAAQKELRESLQSASLVAFDTENDFLGPRQYPIVGMSFAAREKGTLRAWYVPVTPETVKEWKELLESTSVKKVGHNLKYDVEVLRQSNIELGGIVFDSMLASYLLNPGARQYSLDALAASELNYHPIPLTDLIGSGKAQKHLSQVPLMELARYAAEDAEVALRLYEKLLPKVKQEDLGSVLDQLEVPLIPVLASMELRGVKIDIDTLTKLHQKVSSKIAGLKKNIWKMAGGEFNINSTKQLRVILYEKLSLPTVNISRTQTGFSTAAAELAKLKGAHPIVDLLEEYRELTKLLSTYIDTLPKIVDQKTGRIHASFNQTIAATGRLSSSDPNLQNIPVRTPLGQEIRAAFVADGGHELVKADYSQIELRLAAHIAQDQKMIDTFRAGQDIHRATAAWVYSIPAEKVSDKQRREAKTLNFGVLYGMGAPAFARQAGMSVERARSFIERYKEQYVGVTQLIEATIDQARQQGYVTTLFGRKRYLPEINSRNPQIRSQAERMAFNFPLQGTQADILKKAMILLHSLIKDRFPAAGLVLTVHDELVAEVPSEEVADFGQMMKQAMESIITLDVPLVVDVTHGPNWRELHPIS